MYLKYQQPSDQDLLDLIVEELEQNPWAQLVDVVGRVCYNYNLPEYRFDELMDKTLTNLK